jgi:HSP20 family protein
MTSVPVEVKKTVPTRTTPAMPDVWQAFRTEMDRVFDRFAGGYGFPSLSRLFSAEPFLRWETSTMLAPAMDITEDTAGYKLTAELPGLTEKDIEVEVRGNVLTLKGEKKQESERTEADVHLSERSYGAFARSFTLPEGVDSGTIAAEFTNGVLTLTLPKLPAAMPQTKTIEVKPAAAKPAEVKKAA